MGLLDKKKSLLTDEQSHWGDVANRLGTDISNYGGSALRGLLKGTVGLPVGLHNLVSDVTGRGSQIDTLSPEWVGKKVQPYLPDGNTKTEIAGEFINPFGAIKAASIPLMGLMFAGKNAKTADLFKLRKAEEMLKKGGSDRDAYAQTGWTHGFADKKPRFEIDDSNVGFNPESYKKFRRMREGSEMPLSTAFPHPELSKAYPSGEKYSGKGDPWQGIGYDDASLRRGRNNDPGGSASPGGFDYVHLNLGYEGPKADLPGMRSTVLHENQHLVQGREGFGVGADPTDMRLVPTMPKEVKNKVAELDKKLKELKNGSSYDDGSEAVLKYGSPERDKVVEEYYALKDRYTGYGTYKRSSGEAEARLTQARKDMTAAERAKSYPPDMFDVPVEDQIVSFGGGKQMMSEGKKLTEGEKIAFKPKIDYLKKMEKCVGKGYSNCHLAAQLTSGETDFSKLKNINIPEESPIVSEWFDKGGTSAIEKILKEGDILNFSKRHYGIYDGKDIIQVPEWGGKPERVNMKSVFESYNPPTQIITPNPKNNKKPTGLLGK